MGVYESGGQSNKALKQLLSRWEEAKLSWHDSVSTDFENRYLVPLQADVKATLGALAQMGTLLDQVKRDCT